MAICLSSFAAGLAANAAEPVQLISARSAAVALPAGGNGDSVAPNLTPDGRFVVFSSTANDLVPEGNSYDCLNVLLRDRERGTTVLVSPDRYGAGGGNAASMPGQASTNGQLVVFQSEASDLVPGDTNQATDIFIGDLAKGITELVSVSTNGGAANGDSTDPVMTSDGRCVAFLSQADNLAPGAGAGTYWRDIDQGRTVAMLGAGEFAPSLAGDGRYVACSAGNDFSIPSRWSIRGTQSGANLYTNTGSVFAVVMDPTGAKVAYETGTGTAGTFALRVDDVGAGTNLFAVNTQSRTPASWSDDGRWLTFVSDTNLSGGTDDLQKVYLKDFQTRALTLVGLAGPATDGTAASSDGPVISGDGSTVAAFYA